MNELLYKIQNHIPGVIGDKDRFRSAVCIALVRGEEEYEILFEVRSRKILAQPGDICLPGGAIEVGESPEQTAIRETCEELGIGPDDIEVISELEPLIMGDGREVYPVSARLHIKDIESLALSEDEVTEVFLLPIKWLQENPPVHYDLAATTDDELPEKLLGFLKHYGEYRKTGHTDYLEYDGHGIWGLTARIIKNLGDAELN